MAKTLIKLKYWWYYCLGEVACELCYSKWEWKANLFYPLYNKWMTKASDISVDNNLGYWKESKEHKN